MDDPQGLWTKMGDYLRGIDDSLGVRPKAILVISGHWETSSPAVLNVPTHSLLFDYHGFPKHTYELTYPAPGSAEVASRTRELLAKAGMKTVEEHTRGLDHGVFVPFKLIYPNADVPIVQLSLQENFDTGEHLAIGRALESLRDEEVLIVGSGMSFHNLRAFFSMDARVIQEAEAFDGWLRNTLSDIRNREQELISWRKAPGAVSAHPTPEHLLPLMVAAGAAEGEPATVSYHEPLLGKPISAFQFG
jgi:aromatic ring-opening dioxygenase catalytic subunit (LigB family)